MIPDPSEWAVRTEPEYSTAVYLVSGDPQHHAWLALAGDFADYDEKLAYARDIARRLNETRPK